MLHPSRSTLPCLPCPPPQETNPVNYTKRSRLCFLTGLLSRGRGGEWQGPPQETGGEGVEDLRSWFLPCGVTALVRAACPPPLHPCRLLSLTLPCVPLGVGALSALLPLALDSSVVCLSPAHSFVNSCPTNKPSLDYLNLIVFSF